MGEHGSEIAAIEMEGRVAAAWKKISGGLADLASVIEDVLEPKQSDLFPLDSGAVMTDVRTVLNETERRMARVAEHAGGGTR